ncbi:two-component system sensor histidine kinase NtrB [Nisaea sediminum]|uniref:two-component system sensor histidine kinase NtrB n=1 Tax=Nisaea sediminum TaxID=2775867 RepID=UPI00186790E2|nr:ATP-binding protein [Nisaea sediminum]
MPPLSENLELFLESVPDAMLIVDSEGRIVLANARMEELFGYTRAELMGQPVEMLMPNAHRKRHIAFREGYLRAPRARDMAANLELKGVRRSGEQFPVEISLSPIPSSNGILISSAIRDVTDRLERERKARAREVELEKLANMNRFLFSLSHELRTPLNAICGFTTALLMELAGPINEKQRTQLSTVEESAAHLLALINQLLSLQNPDFGTDSANLERLDCGEVASSVCKMIEPEAAAKGLSLTLQHMESAPVLRTNRRILTQILINLVGNAVKYTDKGGVTVSVRREESHQGPKIEFMVKDTGIGIPQGAQAHLFEMFYRSNREREGTGLGLFISQQLAGRLGGRITFVSEPGKGSVFTFSLHQKGAENVGANSGYRGSSGEPGVAQSPS